MAGPDVPDGRECTTPAAIVDISATALEIPGLRPTPRRSTITSELAATPDDPDRTVFAEYHDGGSSTGAFMVRWRNWKYIRYTPSYRSFLIWKRIRMNWSISALTPRTRHCGARGRRPPTCRHL